jgi:hypothetical protein
MVVRRIGMLTAALATLAAGLLLGTAQAHADTAAQVAAPLPQAQFVSLSSLLSTGSSFAAPLAAAAANMLDVGDMYPKPVLQALALAVVPLDQIDSFNQIISHESSWNVFAINPTSGAYGLPQALPGWKMFETGPDWMFDPLTQIRWAYDYMCQRYGSPNAAWAFWQANHWY